MREAAMFVAGRFHEEPFAVRAVRNAMLAPARWWARRRTMVRLLDLDDHILSDIGVSRDEVRQVNALPLSFDIGIELSERVARRRQARSHEWRRS